MKKLTLSEIWIYPVKSLGGIRLDSGKVMPKGLEYDRRWMLVDDQGVFMSQRIFPRMARFTLKSDKTHFAISYEGHSIFLPFHSPVENQVQVQVWDDVVMATEVSKEHSQSFSDLLNVKCKLVYFPENNSRPIDARYRIREDDQTSLSDGYPFLIIGQSSLNDLNRRLPLPLPINRFRPNFVFTGGEPYEEDHWRNFAIGSNKFVGVKPCARCIIPTIDQQTSEKSPEPLKTLSTYRKRDNKIFFGQNLIAVDYTEVSVGDNITVN